MNQEDAFSGDQYVRANFAADTDDSDLLDYMSYDKSIAVLLSVCSNKNTHFKTLARIHAFNDNMHVTSAIVSNRNIYVPDFSIQLNIFMDIRFNNELLEKRV